MFELSGMRNALEESDEGENDSTYIGLTGIPEASDT